MVPVEGHCPPNSLRFNITMYELVRTQLYLNMVHGVVFTINYMFRPLYWPSSDTPNSDISGYPLFVKRDLVPPPTPEHALQIV